MRREMSLLRESHPDLAPGLVFELATEGGGRALGWPRVGHLRPGSEADVVAWRMQPGARRDALEQLTAGRPPVGHVFVGGRQV